jgi:hypothetical protein
MKSLNPSAVGPFQLSFSFLVCRLKVSCACSRLPCAVPKFWPAFQKVLGSATFLVASRCWSSGRATPPLSAFLIAFQLHWFRSAGWVLGLSLSSSAIALLSRVRSCVRSCCRSGSVAG